MTHALALPIPSSVGNIDAYIQAANRYPMLSEAEETRLAERFHSEGDVEAARRWYGETLGLAHLYSFGNLAFFDCGGVRLFLSEGDGGPAESILYFRVPDVRAAHAQLAAKGVEFTHAPHMIHRHDDGTEEWMAFFKDNEGRPLAIMAQVRAVA